MEINIRGDKLKVTDAIRNHITEKLGKLDKYFGEDAHIRCSVVIKVKDKDQIIEVTIPTDKFTLRAEEKHADLYAATDLIVDKLEGQIRKMKTKKDKQNMTESIRLKETNREEEHEIEDEIVKTMYYSIKPMGAEDAKLLLCDQPQNRFLTFVNIETGKVNVIYKLKDNKNYGLIEPEE